MADKKDAKLIVDKLNDFLNEGGNLQQVQELLDKLNDQLKTREKADEAKLLVNTLNEFISKGVQLREIKTMVSNLDDALDLEEEMNTAVITTAKDLTEAERTEVEENLINMYDRPLEFQYVVDPSLLAGMRVKVYDHIIDMTLDNTLETLVQNLKH